MLFWCAVLSFVADPDPAWSEKTQIIYSNTFSELCYALKLETQLPCFFVFRIIFKNFTGPILTSLKPFAACDCDSAYTVGSCEPNTGRCYCKVQYAGDRCDRCAPGYQEFPECRRKMWTPYSKICIKNIIWNGFFKGWVFRVVGHEWDISSVVLKLSWAMAPCPPYKFNWRILNISWHLGCAILPRERLCSWPSEIRSVTPKGAEAPVWETLH